MSKRQRLQPLEAYQAAHPFFFSCFWFPFYLLSSLWAVAAIFRRKLLPAAYRSQLRTWCVGNLSAGGSGKTPLTLALWELLKDLSPAIISRGYGGEAEHVGGIVATSDVSGAIKYGDEPWMLAHQTKCDVYVGGDRTQSVKKAESNGQSKVLLFDDGFQNGQVHYDETILLWDSQGSRHCLPLGTLREPCAAMARASAIVLASKGSHRSELKPKALPEFAQKVPCFDATFLMEGPFDHEGKITKIAPNQAVGAFCGIASPDSFFEELRNNYQVLEEACYADHYGYTPLDIERLNQQAMVKNLSGYVTTEKDWYRLGRLKLEFRVPLYWFGLKIRVENSFREYVKRKSGL